MKKYELCVKPPFSGLEPVKIMSKSAFSLACDIGICARFAYDRSASLPGYLSDGCAKFLDGKE